jgi:hypothetical protein
MSPHTDEVQKHEENLHKHPTAPDGQSEPCRMLGIVLIIVIVAGILFVLAVLPFLARIGG